MRVDRQTDGRTVRHNESNSRFSHFVNAPKLLCTSLVV